MKQGAGGKGQEVSWLMCLFREVSHVQPRMIARGSRRHLFESFQHVEVIGVQPHLFE